jgi:DNA processing protein
MGSPIPEQELNDWLRLVATPGVGDVLARRLLASFGSPQAIFAQSGTALNQVVSTKQTLALQQVPAEWEDLCKRTQLWLNGGSHRTILTLGDSNYPPELLQTEDPPLMLYAIGNLDLLQHPLRLAVVGSRSPTPQGALNAKDMSAALARSGVCIVSGLALGVDGAAHEGALSIGTQSATIAIVGTGLDRVYPRQHQNLAHRIAEHGLMLSEYPIGTPPLPSHFPKRNRLIAALTQGTLVVEAALSSGSLITAQLALEMGREVFAIPGSIHAPQAKGCHALIRQGAKLVESAQDILEELHIQPGQHTVPAPTDDETHAHEASSPYPSLLKHMDYHPIHIDALQARTGLAAAQLQAQLLELELEGQVARVPGGLFQRLALT